MHENCQKNIRKNPARIPAPGAYRHRRYFDGDLVALKNKRIERDEMIRDLHRLGYSQCAIARQLHLSEEWVRQILKKIRTKKIRCYCPACGRDKIYIVQVENWDVCYSGKGIWPRLCDLHRDSEQLPGALHHRLNEASEREIVQSLSGET